MSFTLRASEKKEEREEKEKEREERDRERLHQANMKKLEIQHEEARSLGRVVDQDARLQVNSQANIFGSPTKI